MAEGREEAWKIFTLFADEVAGADLEVKDVEKSFSDYQKSWIAVGTPKAVSAMSVSNINLIEEGETSDELKMTSEFGSSVGQERNRKGELSTLNESGKQYQDTGLLFFLLASSGNRA
ncbi:hypothetical protein ACH5RR_041000 [Cinchona calisaya]|uniref:Uncharacterized protein n=1 Tax=Cinchona calisaya TaxID=153742 RepID=A0ABD2XTB6_9GENT